ncbi:hypothetical protein T439DRAFT_329124 [Meredithblackwellia eburnea MCA 4105]
MAPRAPWLDKSALSPNEFDSYDSLINAWSTSLGAQAAALGTSTGAAGSVGAATAVWDWLETYLSDNDKARKDEILALFRGPGPQQNDQSGTFLAILRLVSHSQSNKHLTRDHIFLQTTPLSIDVPLIGSDLAATQSSPTTALLEANPFRRSSGPNQIISNVPLRTSSQPQFDSPVSPAPPSNSSSSNRGPPPPLPAKRRPPSPPSSTATTPKEPVSAPPVISTVGNSGGNPFRARNFSAPSTKPFAHFAETLPPLADNGSFGEGSTLEAHKNGLTSPPLPPRPSKPIAAKPEALRKHSAGFMATKGLFDEPDSSPIPPPPVRRSSSMAFPVASISPSNPTSPPLGSSARMSIISSSNASASTAVSAGATKRPVPITPSLQPPHIAPKPPSTKLVSSTHIGPGVKLRNSPSPSPATDEMASGASSTTGIRGRISRSNSGVSSASSATQGPFVYAKASSSSSPSKKPNPGIGVAWPPPSSTGSGSWSGEAEDDDDVRSVVTEPMPSTSTFPSLTSTKSIPTNRLGGATGLNRSRTLGSKPSLPPPPPKRRPDSLILGSSEAFPTSFHNPFDEPNMYTFPLPRSTSSSTTTSSSKLTNGQHHRTPSLTSRSSAPSTVSSGRGTNAPKDLASLGQDLSNLFERGGRQGEEWLDKLKKKKSGRSWSSGVVGDEAREEELERWKSEREGLVKRSGSERRKSMGKRGPFDDQQGDSGIEDDDDGGLNDHLEEDEEDEDDEEDHRRGESKDLKHEREEGWVRIDDGVR